jgi:hypothetical protein
MTSKESARITLASKRNFKPVSSRLETRLLNYAAAATAAGVGLLTAAQSAEAKVVYTQTNTAIQPSVALDLNHDGFVDFNLTKWTANASIEFFSYLMVCHEGLLNFYHQCLSSSSQANDANVVRATKSGAQALVFGALIGPGEQFAGKAGRVTMGGRQGASFSSIKDQTWYGPWMADGAGVKNRYLGLKFMVGNQFHYGWARVTVTTTANSGFTATLTGYAYETIPGKAIRAGQTSDTAEVAAVANDPNVNAAGVNVSYAPPMLGILAAGAQGLTAWRREDS